MSNNTTVLPLAHQGGSLHKWLTPLLLGLVAVIYSTAIAHAQEAQPVWTIYTNSNYVQDLALDPTTGMVWAATGGGVVRWDPATATYTRYTVADGLADNDVKAVAVDAQGNKWFGTEGRGMTRLSPDGQWQTYTPGDSGIADTLVYNIAVDPAGNKWFQHGSAISRLAADNQSWSSFDRSDGIAWESLLSLAAGRTAASTSAPLNMVSAGAAPMAPGSPTPPPTAWPRTRCRALRSIRWAMPGSTPTAISASAAPMAPGKPTPKTTASTPTRSTASTPIPWAGCGLAIPVPQAISRMVRGRPRLSCPNRSPARQ
ncbi:MAG: hypothetical protein R2932_14780 [Caldilineaceae bacterium]